MKSKTTAGLLGIFLGEFGLHWFYLGKNNRGICYLGISIVGMLLWFLPFIVVGIVGFIEGIMLLCKNEDDFDEEYNYDYIHANKYQQPQQQFYQQPQQQYTAPQQPTQQPRPKNDFSSKTDKLKDLKALLDAGVLTQEEFDTEKKKILNG
jgi:TM2 domain-containing membrane protein YozV